MEAGQPGGCAGVGGQRHVASRVPENPGQPPRLFTTLPRRPSCPRRACLDSSPQLFGLQPQRLAPCP